MDPDQRQIIWLVPEQNRNSRATNLGRPTGARCVEFLRSGLRWSSKLVPSAMHILAHRYYPVRSDRYPPELCSA